MTVATEVTVETRSTHSASQLARALARSGNTETVIVGPGRCDVLLDLDSERGRPVAEVLATVEDWLRHGA